MSDNNDSMYDEELDSISITRHDLSPQSDIMTSDISREWKEALLPVYDGIDIKNSIIYMYGEIGPMTLVDTVTKVRAILAVRPEGDTSPVTIFINSPGGDIYEAFGIVDFIRTLPVKVNTICRGHAMSAAAIVLAAGTGRRVAGKHSSIMLHEISFGMYGKTKDVKDSTKHLQRLQLFMEELLGSCTKKDSEWWSQNIDRDMYITAQEALELGVIDEIG